MNLKLDRRGIWIVAGVLVFLALRLWYAGRYQLVPDETVYWQWSRHLQWGYLDHPPMIAGLIALSTRVFGNTEFGVRLPAVLLAWGSLLVLLLGSWPLYRDRRITGLIALMWLTSPLLMLLGTISTPDPPAFFLSCCALLCVLGAVADDTRAGRAACLWIAAGVFVGLGLVAKYTAVLLPFSIGLALVTSKEGRREFLRPWPWISGAIAIAIFWPVIRWNQRHDWISFAFQLHHGAGGDGTGVLRGLGEFIGGQALVWTPVLFGVAMVVLWDGWRGLLHKEGRQESLPHRILVWAGTVPLIFFGYSATRSHTEMNWPAFMYVPISFLTAEYVARHWTGERSKWVIKGCAVALAITIALHFPGVLIKLGADVPSLADLYNSRALGQAAQAHAQGLPVICNRHQDAGMTSFYMDEQPDNWAVSVGSRPTAFDYMDDAPDLRKLDRVDFVGWHVKQFCEKYGFVYAKGDEVEIPTVRKSKRVMLMTRLERSR